MVLFNVVGLDTNVWAGRLEGTVSIPSSEKGFCCSTKHPDAVWSQTTPTPLLNGHRAQFSQGRVEGRETDQSPRSIDEIRNDWRAQEHVFLLLHFHFIG